MFLTFGPYVYYPDNNFYLSVLLWRKTTLIANFVGGKGANPRTYNEYNSLMSLALSVPIFNKKYPRKRAVETFKFWPKYESFHSSCPMRILMIIGKVRAKDT